MKTTAAILVEINRPLVIDDLEIPALQPGQVLVEIAVSGVCQTQLLEVRGERGPDTFLPHCLGHEASGTVVEIGAGVHKCRAGDRVLLSWIKGSGANVPGTTYRWGSRIVNAGGVTTFSRRAVVSENRLTVLTAEIPAAEAALLGCAVPTGAGAVFNTAGVKRGESVAVFGVGGVGLCAVAAAAIANAAPIVAIDISDDRLGTAMQVGATHAINAGKCDVLTELAKIRPAGFDYAIEASGRPAVMQQSLLAVRNQGGATVVIGNARAGEFIELDPKQLNLGKRLLGTWGGDNDPDRDFPRYLQLVSEGRLNLAPLLSTPYKLLDINQAIDDFASRRVTRPLIDMSLT